MKSITPQFYTVGVFAFINLILIVSVHAASQEAFISSTETPSFEQAVDDLMIEYNISSDSENNFKPKLWGILQFKHQEADLYTFFINLFELDQHKNILICDACPALLASVTYIKDKDKWTIKGINKEIAKTGSDDSFPEFEQSQYKNPVGEYLILPSSTNLRQGYFSEFGYAVIYLDDWQSKGLIMLADGNTGSDECMSDNICWYWHTRSLQILANKTNGLPDILLERMGTVFDHQDRKIIGVEEETYQFLGNTYQSSSVSQPSNTQLAPWQ